MLNIKLILQDQIFCFIIEATVCIISNAKDSKIKPYPFCLCNILKDFTIDNMKKKKKKKKKQGSKDLCMFFLLIIILLMVTILWKFINI